MNIYGDSIFESYETLYNSIKESSKIFLEFEDDIVDEANESFMYKLLESLKNIILRLTDFIHWVKNKVKSFFRDSQVKLRSIQLQSKLDTVKKKIMHLSNESAYINEDVSEEELQMFLRSKVDTYRVTEGDSIIVRKVHNINQIQIEQNDQGDYILLVPGIGLKSEFIECVKDTIENFVHKYQVFVLSLEKVGDKLTRSAESLNAKLNELKQRYNEIKNSTDTAIDDLKGTTNKEGDSIIEDIKKVKILISNHTMAINVITESINRMITIANGIEHKLATY